MSEKKPKNPKQAAWSRNWNENHLDRLFVTVPKGIKQVIEAHAKKNGESVNKLIARLLRRELGLSVDEWKERNPDE